MFVFGGGCLTPLRVESVPPCQMDLNESRQEVAKIPGTESSLTVIETSMANRPYILVFFWTIYSSTKIGIGKPSIFDLKIKCPPQIDPMKIFLGSK